MLKPFGKRKSSDEMTLQITSMADIFTIILVFLLKSYATSAIDVAPSGGMKLAEGRSHDLPVEALKIEISQGTVQLESKPIVELDNFHFHPGEVQENMASKALSQALETERKRGKIISESNSDVKESSKVLIIADQRTPYVTLKSVLAAAAVNGYTDYKLVVVNKE